MKVEDKKEDWKEMREQTIFSGLNCYMIIKIPKSKANKMQKNAPSRISMAVNFSWVTQG